MNLIMCIVLQIYIIFLLNQVLVKEVLLSHLEQMKISHLCLKQIFMNKKIIKTKD